MFIFDFYAMLHQLSPPYACSLLVAAEQKLCTSFIKAALPEINLAHTPYLPFIFALIVRKA